MARKRSGGPRTPEGKARSARNALKHGIRSQDPVIPDVESAEVWEAHRQWIVDSYEVEGAVEQALANRIASLFWRLERIIEYEKALVASRRNRIWDDVASWARMYYIMTKQKPEDQELIDLANAHAAMRIVPDDDGMSKIRRYESHLHRMLLQTMRQLDAMQSRRNRDQSPEPPEIDGDIYQTNPRRRNNHSPT